jgi:hypothetical protein
VQEGRGGDRVRGRVRECPRERVHKGGHEGGGRRECLLERVPNCGREGRRVRVRVRVRKHERGREGEGKGGVRRHRCRWQREWVGDGRCSWHRASQIERERKQRERQRKRDSTRETAQEGEHEGGRGPKRCNEPWRVFESDQVQNWRAGEAGNKEGRATTQCHRSTRLTTFYFQLLARSWLGHHILIERTAQSSQSCDCHGSARLS